MILRANFSQISSEEKLSSEGFSLIEVVLAIAVFSLTILAVVGMLGSTSQATSEILDTTTASLVADGVKAELEKIGHSGVVGATGGTGAKGDAGTPIVLYATKDGDTVVLSTDPNLNTRIPERERFYEITLERLVGPMGYQPNNSHIAVSMVLVWPFKLPTGPGAAAPVTTVPPEQRSQARFNMAVLLTQ